MRKDRTLIRVQMVGVNNLVVVIPGWSQESIIIPRSIVPVEYLDNLKLSGIRFFALVNLGATTAEHLNISDFSLAPDGQTPVLW